MSEFLQKPWVAALLHRSGIRDLVERLHHESAEHKSLGPATGPLNWKSFLLRARQSILYPILVGLLALISAATGLYPFGPVLVAAVVFAPARWRSTYFSSCLGAALGAVLLALLIQSVGSHLIGELFPGLEQSAHWHRAERWIASHGLVALAANAALPIPQLPSLLILALSDIALSLIGLAIFAGKLCKYGVYVLLVLLLVKAIHKRKRQHSVRT